MGTVKWNIDYYRKIRDIFGAKCIQHTLYPAKFTASDISSGKCLWFGCKHLQTQQIIKEAERAHGALNKKKNKENVFDGESVRNIILKAHGNDVLAWLRCWISRENQNISDIPDWYLRMWMPMIPTKKYFENEQVIKIANAYANNHSTF